MFCFFCYDDDDENDDNNDNDNNDNDNNDNNNIINNNNNVRFPTRESRASARVAPCSRISGWHLSSTSRTTAWPGSVSAARR